MEMDALKALLNNDDRFCRYNGMRIDVLRLGYAEAVMDITENSLNGLGIAQGGSIFTLADLAFAGAANSHGFRTVGLNSNINFIRPGVGRQLRAKSAAAAAPASTASRSSMMTAKSSPTAAQPASSPKKNFKNLPTNQPNTPREPERAPALCPRAQGAGPA